MAGFDIEFPNDFLGGVLETDPQELCSEMLSEAAPLYVDSMKRSLRGVVCLLYTSTSPRDSRV